MSSYRPPDLWDHPSMATHSRVLTDQDAQAKWHELAPLLDRMMERVGTENEFPVEARSSLAGDDKAAAPYQVSHVVRMCLTAGTDHLHAAKTLIVDQGIVHVAAPSSLARGALETFATAFWILHPAQRDERVTRSLRWHVKNMQDAEDAVQGRGWTGYVPLKEKLESLDVVSDRRSLDLSVIHRGYTSTATVKYAELNLPDLPLGVVLPWRLCSAFAHGRPWAFLGSLDVLTGQVGRSVVTTRSD